MSSPRSSTLLFVYLFLLWSSPAMSAAPPLVLPVDDTTRLDVGGRLEYLEDPTGELELEQARASTAWQPPTGKTLNFGFTDSVYFFRLTVKNPSKAAEDFVWVVPFALLDNITAWISSGGQTRTWTVGDHHPFEDRPVQTRQFAFPMTVGPRETSEFVLRVQTSTAMRVPLLVGTANAQARAETSAQLWHGMYFGVLGIMLLYNLFLLGSTRQSIYLHYMAYVAAVGLFQLTYQGFFHAFLLPNALFLNSESTAPLLSLVVLFSLSFAYQFLELETRHPRIALAFRGGFVISIGLFLVSFFLPNNSVIVPVLLTVGVACTLCIGAGVVSWVGGFKPARFYILAWCAMLVTSIVEVFTSMGWLPLNPATASGVQLGTAAEVALMAFGLADRINLTRTAAESAEAEALKHDRAVRVNQQRLLEQSRALRQAQNKVLEVERRVTQTLERSVKARTAELAEANRRLQALTTIDADTQLPNARYFADILDNELRRARRREASVGVVVLRIDGLMRFEDPSAFDPFLGEIAAQLRASVGGPGDHAARLGDARFALLLTDTSHTQASATAAKLRQSVQGIPAFAQTQPDALLLVTVGVSVAIPDGTLSGVALLAKADTASKAQAAER